MRRLSSMKAGEKFIYDGKVCTLDTSRAPSNRRFPIVALETGEEFKPFGKTFVEEYSEPVEVEPVEVEPVEAEVVEEEKTPYILKGYNDEEDTEDEAPF